MFDGCLSMNSAKNKNKGKLLIRLELCEILNRFFDLGITIWNGWDNKTYTDKMSYCRYIVDYDRDTDTPEKEMMAMIENAVTSAGYSLEGSDDA